MRFWTRVFPALAVGLLLASALSLSHRVRTAAGAALTQDCVVSVQQQLAHDSSVLCITNTGVVQPLAAFANVSACSVSVHENAAFTVAMRQWDPVALAPDPSTLALRVDAYGPSRVQQNPSTVRVDFRPPVVTRALSGVADPPRGSVAFIYWYDDYNRFYPQYADYLANGPSAMPAAFAFNTSGAMVPISGEHPVATHWICGGATPDQDQYVLQSVMTTDILLDASPQAVIQKIRVPAAVDVQWVELALPLTNLAAGTPLGVAILDAWGQPLPPVELPAALGTQSRYYSEYLMEHWMAMPSFDQPVHLEPNHDYWLLAQIEHQYALYGRMRHGNESTVFAGGIGAMFTRALPGQPWSPRLDANLAFRLIGTAPSVVDVASLPLARATFALRVSPNPSSGEAFVDWRAARGPVRIEVLDAHGRRVGGGEGTGAAGRWRWSAPPRGSAGAAGVYFVRATDGEGHVTSARFVRVR